VNTELSHLPEGSLPSESPPPRVGRADHTIEEMEHVRVSELRSISERLDLLVEVPRARKWELRSQWLYAAAAGGGVGFIPFLAEKPSTLAAIAYVVVVGIVLLIGRLSFEAADDTRAERSESVSAIKQHIVTHMLATKTLASSTDDDAAGPAASPYVA
jgi:hypothetical protein